MAIINPGANGTTLRGEKLLPYQQKCNKNGTKFLGRIELVKMGPQVISILTADAGLYLPISVISWLQEARNYMVDRSVCLKDGWENGNEPAVKTAIMRERNFKIAL